VAVTVCLGTYIHDNPLGITPIADINAGRVGAGENVTIKGRILSIFALAIGLNDWTLTVGDRQANITLDWTDFRVEVGWVIIARGTVHSSRGLYPTEWLERVWLFV